MMDEHATQLGALGWKARELGGFIDTAGPLWTRHEEQGWAYGFVAEARHLNRAGVVHGGALGTLMDHVVSSVAWEASGRKPCLTVQLDTHFLAAVKEGMFVEGRAEVEHRTPGMVFMKGTLTVGGRKVMTAQAIMKVMAAA